MNKAEFRFATIKNKIKSSVCEILIQKLVNTDNYSSGNGLYLKSQSIMSFFTRGKKKKKKRGFHPGFGDE